MATETRETTLQMHNGTGGAGPFTYAFTAYEADDIFVSVLNENEASADYGKYEPKTVDTHYELDLTNKRITFKADNYPASSTNLNIAIERRTDITDASPRRKVFQAGSSVKAGDLNQNQIQVLDGLEDLWDKKISKLNPTLHGNIEFPPHQRFEGTQLKGDIQVRKDKVIKFEGTADNDYETTLVADNPQADRTIRLPDNDGYVMLNVLREHAIFIGKADGTTDKADVGGDLTAAYNPSNDKAEFTIANDAVNTAKIADDAVGQHQIADNSIYSAHIVANTIESGDIKDDAVGSAAIAENAITNHHIAGTTILHTNLANDCVTRAKLDAGLVVQNDEVSGHTADNNTIYTTKAVHDNFYRKTGSPDEVVKSTESWPTDGTKDSFVVTPGAVDLRVVALVDEVGGFVAIDNETSFPNTNPDINDGAGTIVSIKSLASAFTSSGSGVATIANGTIGNSTVTINGLANSTTYGAGLGLLVETTSTLNTYKFHRQTPVAADVAAVAAKSTEIGRLGTTDAVADMALLGTTDCVADMALLGTSDCVADMNTLATSDIIDDLDKVATIQANVTKVADIDSNVTTVAGVSSNVTTVAGVSSNVTTVAGIASDVTSVAGKATEIGRLGTTDAVADLALLGTADAVADMNTLGTSSNVTNMNTVAGSIASVNTCASNLTSVANYGDQYQVASSAPNTDGGGNALAAGDLYFNTSANELQVYSGSAWQGGVTATGNLVSTAGSTMTGDLVMDNQADLRFEEATANGSNYIALQAPAAISSNVTLTLPAADGTNGQTLTTNGSGTLSWASGGADKMPLAGGTFTGNITLNAQQDIRFADADSSNWVAFQAPATVSSNVTWTLPAADGTSGQRLQTDGSGALSWGSDSTTDSSKMPLAGGTFVGNTLYANRAATRYYEDSGQGTNYIGLRAPATVASDVTFLLPPADGSSGHILTTNGSGTLTFAAPAAAGATGGGNDEIFVENERTVTTSYSITSTKNAHSVGPIAVNSSAVVTIPENSTWMIV